MQSGFINIVVLFGGVQALSLCIYLFFRKTENKPAHRFFILFLLCIAFYNLGYAAIFMDVQIGLFNMGMQPIPFKYLIAPLLFGYVTFSLNGRNKSLNQTIGVLMLPAALYGVLRLYWLYMILSKKNPLIIKEAYDAGFFTGNEIIYLTFSLILSLLMLKRVKDRRQQTVISFGAAKNWRWLKRISKVFMSLCVIHLLLVLASLLVIGTHIRLFYYPTLIINTLFVYWIGFVGYTKSNLLSFKPLVKETRDPSINPEIQKALEKAMRDDKLFTNPKLTSQQLATHLNIPTNEITKYVNDQLGYNFSQYLNRYRTEEAMRLMKTELTDKYKLEALAHEAGFNSKSSFYKIFKDQTGQTPAAYLKTINK